MSHIIKPIVLALFIFGLCAVSGAVNWVFQFAALCFVYPFTQWLMRFTKTYSNIHWVIWPFPITYAVLIIYDYFVQRHLFNLMSVTIPFAPLISFILLKKTESWNKFKIAISYPFFFLLFFIFQDSYIILVGITESQSPISDTEIIRKNDRTYFWSTQCGYCIREMPILRKYLEQGSLNAICVARNSSDSTNAAGIASRKEFRSVIVINKEIEEQIKAYPTWVLSKSSGKTMLNLYPSYLFGYGYSLMLWDLFFD